MKGDPKEWAEPLRLLLTVGWYVSLSLMIPVGIGYWLDQPEMFNKSPLFTFIGLGVGTFIAFFGLIRILLRYQAEQEALRKEKDNKEKQERASDKLKQLLLKEIGNGTKRSPNRRNHSFLSSFFCSFWSLASVWVLSGQVFSLSTPGAA